MVEKGVRHLQIDMYRPSFAHTIYPLGDLSPLSRFMLPLVHLLHNLLCWILFAPTIYLLEDLSPLARSRNLTADQLPTLYLENIIKQQGDRMRDT